MHRHVRLVLPDVHFPFHDSELVRKWLEHLGELKPNGVDIIGDLIDCYSLSRFDKNPARKADLQVELDLARSFLEAIRQIGGQGCDIRYSEGNHEDRLRKLLWGKSPQLVSLRDLTIPQMLGLKKLNIKWHPTQKPYQIWGVWYTHGDILRTSAGMSARAKADMIHGSVIMGHCHRMGWSPRTVWTGVEDAYEVGYLADHTQLDYVRSGTPNWQQGWAVVEYPPEGGHQVSFATVHTRFSGKKFVYYKGEKL